MGREPLELLHMTDNWRQFHEDRRRFRESGILDHEGGEHGPLVPGEAPEPESGYTTPPDWDDFDPDAGNEFPLDP